MAIADRVKEAIDKLSQGDPVNALIQVSIAIDGTGKKLYPQQTTSYRCRRFIKANQAFIIRVGFEKIEISGPIIFKTAAGEKTFEQVFYDLVRCSLLHEGSLPNEVIITKEAKIGLNHDGKVIIYEKLIWAMILAVIGSHVNQHETLPDYYTATVGGTTLNLNTLWGEKDKIYNLIVKHNK